MLHCAYFVLLCVGVLLCNNVDVLCAVVLLFVLHVSYVCVCLLLLFYFVRPFSDHIADLCFNVVLFVCLSSCVVVCVPFVRVCLWFVCVRFDSSAVTPAMCYRWVCVLVCCYVAGCVRFVCVFVVVLFVCFCNRLVVFCVQSRVVCACACLCFVCVRVYVGYRAVVLRCMA